MNILDDPREKTALETVIVFIDEDLDLQRRVARLLEEAGHTVATGGSAAEALALCTRHRPRLLLMPLSLPDGEGMALARQLKRDPEMRGVFLVLVSGERLTAPEQRERIARGVADGYLFAPLPLDELPERIDTFLRIREGEEALRQKCAELEDLTYTISHDLKSPLITIRSYSEMLQRTMGKSPPERMERDLLRIEQAARKMEELLTSLLKLSRAGRPPTSREEVPLHPLVAEVLDRFAPRLKERQVAVSIPAALPPLRGERARLAEVVAGLVENAVKYMGCQESPRIEIGMSPGEREQVLFVRDNGIGIAAADHGRIFALYEKVDPKSAGTGAGLAVVKRIVEAHGGRVWVESEGAGAGSTFFAAFPDNTQRSGTAPC